MYPCPCELIVPFPTLVLYTVLVVVGVRRALLCDSLYLSLVNREHRRPPIQYKLNPPGMGSEVCFFLSGRVYGERRDFRIITGTYGHSF